MAIVYPKDYSSATLRGLLDEANSEVLFLGDPRVSIDPGPQMFDRMEQVLRESGAAIAYSDAIGHPRIDYQLGSIRDGFDFGPVTALAVRAAREVDIGSGWRWGAVYDLRLRLSEKYRIVRIPEPLYSASISDARPTGERQFDYVDQRNRDYQIEMEQIATAHLKRIGALLPPQFADITTSATSFPVKASIVIPVRNRERTVLDAAQSALEQKTNFTFNVIVVDNHSTDRTTTLLNELDDARVKHLIPERRDLEIGGCWNEAIRSAHCGQYAVQLDSDDLYADTTTLQQLVDKLEEGPYAMVVGSYTMVDFALKEIPPGLIDHREWTRDNGRNNALRINGLGAPRAFNTALLRAIGFPNVSYGEDYAVALRISREYEIGRIYDSLYLCRRWEGNSDSALPLETANRYDYYKDWLRTRELQARMRR